MLWLHPGSFVARPAPYFSDARPLRDLLGCFFGADMTPSLAWLQSLQQTRAVHIVTRTRPPGTRASTDRKPRARHDPKSVLGPMNRPRRRPSVNGRQKSKTAERGPAAMLTDRARTGIHSGPELPFAHLLEHRSLGHAGQVILWLVLIGLAAAVAYVLLEVVLASAGGLGPHPPWPPPHPVPVPNPTPVPPGP
jgi:hypothetical protein